MKLRTKLILAFLLMAVLPLGVISLYSYNSSLKAFHQALQAETSALTQEMSGGVASVRSDLSHRIEQLGSFPFQRLMTPQGAASEGQSAALAEQLRSTMGEAASLVESLEFSPMRPPAGYAPRGGRIRPGFPPPGRPPGTPPDPGKLVIQILPERSSDSKPMPVAVPGSGPDGSVVRWVVPNAGTPPTAPLRPPEVPGLDRRQGRAGRSPASGSADPNRKTAQEARQIQEQMSRDIQEARAKAALAMQVIHEQTKNTVGGEHHYRLEEGGNAVGTLKAQVSGKQIFRRALIQLHPKPGDIPFAIDSEGNILTADPKNMPTLESLPLKASVPAAAADINTLSKNNFVVVTRKDGQSGTTYGIARPVGQALEEIRRTAVRNLGFGLGLVAVALLGILPLSNRMTRNLNALTRGAEQLAQGHLDTTVPVNSHDEIGRLAETFNRMARDLSLQQKQLVEQERMRSELDMCRRIQEELLPRQSLRSGSFEVRGVSIPAREVGGDFFNYFPLPNEHLAVIVGDVSGKGLPAAMMMSNLQARLQARLPMESDLAVLAGQLDHEVAADTPAEVYLAMFVGIVDIKQRKLRYVNAGHNTQFALHRNGRVDPLESSGRPIGLLPGTGYTERTVPLEEGDSLFLYTDGLVDSENASGEIFGIERLEALLLAHREAGVDKVLAAVEASVQAFRNGIEAGDDATMVALRVGAECAVRS